MLHSQARDGADFSDQDMIMQGKKLQAIILSEMCCPNTALRRHW
jgi:hypothetical protein